MKNVLLSFWFQMIVVISVYKKFIIKNAIYSVLIIISTICCFLIITLFLFGWKLFQLKFINSRFSPYQKECDKYNMLSINHEMYLRNEQKTSKYPFDEKPYYLNEIECTPWNWKEI